MTPGTQKILLKLAWRNLWRNNRRTLIMLAAITTGVWAMIFMTALMRGMVDDMVDRGIENFTGHIQFHHPDYRDDPSINNSIDAIPQELLARFNAPPVKAWSQRLRVPAVITSERESLGGLLMGVVPAQERQLSFVAQQISAGRFLQSENDSGIIIGERMAERLKTGLGKRIVVMSQKPDNTIADRGFRIVGLYHAEPESLEELYILTGLETAQQFLDVNNGISEIELVTDNYRDLDPLLKALEPLRGELSINSWKTLNGYLGTLLDTMDGFVLIWMVVIFIALSFGLVNTLVMAVFERVREIGLMQALGMKPLAIMFQIIYESLLLLMLGLFAGNLLAWATIKPLESGIDISVVAEGMAMFGSGSILYPSLTPQDMMLSTTIVIILGLLASILPAWQASRYNPVTALNTQ